MPGKEPTIWKKNLGKALLPGLRTGTPSTKRAKESGVHNDWYDFVVAQRAKRVATNKSSFAKENMARCHRASDKYTRGRLLATSELLVNNSLEQKRNDAFNAAKDYMSTIHDETKGDKRTNEAVKLIRRALDDQRQKGHTSVAQLDFQGAVNRLANHASENFFIGDGSANSSIGPSADGRTRGAKLGGTRSPTPTSQAIHKAGRRLDEATGRSVSPRTRAFSDGKVPMAMKTSSRPGS